MVDTRQILVSGEVPNIFRNLLRGLQPCLRHFSWLYISNYQKIIKLGLKNLVVIASFIFIFNVNFILQLPQTMLRF